MEIKASVCIDAVLPHFSLEEALTIVARSGYQAFEFWCWWEKDLDAMLALQERLNLRVAATCTRFVSLVDPACRESYLAGLQTSIAAAQRVNCPVLISQVGDARLGVSRKEQRDSMVDGLRQAADLLSGTGITLAIEPLNELVDHAGYYLVRSDEAFEIVDEVGCDQIRVTFDIYHQQISEGNLISNIVRHIDKIAHFHAAGNPGRHELTCGEINYPEVLKAIAETNYSGHFGLEYWPLCDAETGLREVAKWF